MQVLLTNEECDHIKLYYGSEMVRLFVFIVASPF